MYKAVGEAAYNDGLFSQAAPYQAYQASVSQFGDGGLGALRIYGGARQPTKYRYAGASRRPPRVLNPHASGSGYNSVVGLGATSRLTSYADGTLGMGKTFLPAFSPRAMQGLGYSFRDGVLGDAASIVPSSVMPVTQDNLTAATNSLDTKIDARTKTGLLWVGALTLAVGYLYMKR